jgi:hypothetical protein
VEKADHENPKLTSAGLFFYPILSSTDSRWADPDATTLIRIQNEAGESSFGMWLKERRNRRALPYRLEQCGYSPVRNDAEDGLWKINDARQAV